MLKPIFGALLCAGALLQAVPASAHTTDPLVVSCYRGPWKDVIWDRANPVFIDGLMRIGYDITTAESIATRVCRDPGVVYDHAAMRELTKRLIRETPITRRR